MSAYVLTPLAKADIFEIWAYIAENNENAAGREEAIYDACAFLAEGPVARSHTARLYGTSPAFLNPKPLSQLHYCLPAGHSPLQIIAVLHGKRNIRRILKERS